MDFETIDVLYRSRQTLLQILKAKGFNTKPYERFGPFEIETMASNDKELSLGMALTMVDETIPAKCIVEYALPRVKNRLKGYLERFLYNDEGELTIDPATTEIIVMTLEPIGESFNVEALKKFSGSPSIRISFFDANTLVANPLEHVLVPKHERIPKEDEQDLLTTLRCTSKLNLPKIRYHEDIVGRILGLVPGDIVKITRPSPTAGQTFYYRVCMP